MSLADNGQYSIYSTCFQFLKAPFFSIYLFDLKKENSVENFDFLDHIIFVVCKIKNHKNSRYGFIFSTKMVYMLLYFQQIMLSKNILTAKY